MKLYHVKFGHTPTELTLYPAIPLKTMAGEDRTIPRVCFAESWVHCMNALSTSYFDDKEDLDQSLITVYTLDCAETYKHMTNEQLIKGGLVYDAILTKEWWILETVTVTGKHCEIEYTDSYGEHECYQYYEDERDKVMTNLKPLLTANDWEKVQPMLVFTILNDYLPKLSYWPTIEASLTKADIRPSMYLTKEDVYLL